MKFYKTVLALFAAAACCLLPASAVRAEGEEPLRIVTTIFPEYDWVMRILGENPGGAEVTMLLDKGVDLHSFQPTAADILELSRADLFLYVGGESDGWVEDALKEVVNPDQKALNLLELLGDAVKTEELVEGMQEEEHDHGDGDHEDEEHEHEDEEHEEEEGHEHAHEEEADEHVWLSLRNAQLLCTAISEALQQADPERADLYRANTEAYLEELAALDAAYRETVEAAPVHTLLFGDRFPFRYMTDDYGLTYYAAFAGCSAETEASFETIAFLSAKVDELGLTAIMTIDGTDHRIAETIRNSTKTKDQRILAMDSLQSKTAADVEAGATYLGTMESNLEVLREALN